MRAALLPLLALTTLVASAAEPGFERIPVIELLDNGKPKFYTVRLPVPPEPLATHVCIREFEAPAIRCYVLDRQNMDWLTFDFDVKQ